jgi:hypothetical protein
MVGVKAMREGMGVQACMYGGVKARVAGEPVCEKSATSEPAFDVYVWRGGQVRGRGPQVGEVGVTRAGLVRVARVQLGACVARPQRAVPLVRRQGTAPGFASPGPVRSR